jgi:hypothetical protein
MVNAEQMPTEQVDVLRQRFRLSGNLLKAIRPLLGPPTGNVPMRAYSSKEVTISAQTPQRIITELNGQFMRAAQSFYLTGDIELGADEIFIFPRMQAELNSLARLAYSLTDLQPQPADMDHFFRIKVPTGALLPRDEEDVKNYTRAVTDGTTGRLHSVAPVGLEVMPPDALEAAVTALDSSRIGTLPKAG